MQLPEDSLEALCIHELAHNFENYHDIKFINKMIELGGEKAFKRNQDLLYMGKGHYWEF